MPSLRDIDTDKYPEFVWFARNLILLREQLGLSQGQFAGLCGFTQPYISALESNKANPTLEVMSRIATASGCSVSQLTNKRVLKYTPNADQS